MEIENIKDLVTALNKKTRQLNRIAEKLDCKIKEKDSNDKEWITGRQWIERGGTEEWFYKCLTRITNSSKREGLMEYKENGFWWGIFDDGAYLATCLEYIKHYRIKNDIKLFLPEVPKDLIPPKWYGYAWDEDGSLTIFKQKPIEYETYWNNDTCTQLDADYNLQLPKGIDWRETLVCVNGADDS